MILQFTPLAVTYWDIYVYIGYSSFFICLPYYVTSTLFSETQIFFQIQDSRNGCINFQGLWKLKKLTQFFL